MRNTKITPLYERLSRDDDQQGEGKLYNHLLEVDRAANARMEVLMPQLMQAVGVTEELKAADQMKWVGLMNTLKAQVEEIIQNELIFD